MVDPSSSCVWPGLLARPLLPRNFLAAVPPSPAAPHLALLLPPTAAACCSCCSNLSGRGLTGLIPSDPGLWVGLTGLTNLDLSNNQLTGSVPAAIKSAPLLTNV